MSYRYKEKISDDLSDAEDIVTNLGRSVKKNQININGLMSNLGAALKKIQSAQYYLDRG